VKRRREDQAPEVIDPGAREIAALAVAREVRTPEFITDLAKWSKFLVEDRIHTVGVASTAGDASDRDPPLVTRRRPP
jgi:hypothetical protein